MINRASGMAIQDVEKYQAISASDAMRDAAKNPGGIAGDGIGAGLGLAMGMGMAQQTMKQFTSPEPEVQKRGENPEPTPSTAKLTMDEVKLKLAQMKELQESGLINESDFEEQKKRLISMM